MHMGKQNTCQLLFLGRRLFAPPPPLVELNQSFALQYAELETIRFAVLTFETMYTKKWSLKLGFLILMTFEDIFSLF